MVSSAWLKDNFKGDPAIWGIVALLSLISILTVYSATGALAYRQMAGNTEYYLVKQIFYLLIGILFVWLVHKIDYRYYSKLSFIFLVISILLLIYAKFFGVTINGANRWISILGISFQPSDLAKLSLISFMASKLSKIQKNPAELNKDLLMILGAIAIVCVLILLSNGSNAIMLGMTCTLLLFIGRIPIKYFALLFMVFLVVGVFGFFFSSRVETMVNRVASFTEATKDPTKANYQSVHSYIAIANGGVFGMGPGNSVERNILPEPYSDFIYSIIVEEYGLIGGAFIVFLYLVLLYRGMVTVANSNKAFGGLLSAGLSFSLVIQAIVNMSVAVGLGPVTGLPLPMLSMGGTSLLISGITIGVILSVSKGENEEDLSAAK